MAPLIPDTLSQWDRKWEEGTASLQCERAARKRKGEEADDSNRPLLGGRQSSDRDSPMDLATPKANDEDSGSDVWTNVRVHPASAPSPAPHEQPATVTVEVPMVDRPDLLLELDEAASAGAAPRADSAAEPRATVRGLFGGLQAAASPGPGLRAASPASGQRSVSQFFNPPAPAPAGFAPARAPAPAVPLPEEYTDAWDDTHVRLPCSPHHLIDGVCAWDEITHALAPGAAGAWRGFEDLRAAVLACSGGGRRTLPQLGTLIEVDLDPPRRAQFFAETLPAIARLALALPRVCPAPIELLRRRTDCKRQDVVLNTLQVCRLPCPVSS